MANNDIQINIKTNDGASQALKDVSKEVANLGNQTEKSTSKTQNALNAFKANWLVVTAAIGGTIAALSDFYNAAKESDMVSAKLGQTLKNLGLYTEENVQAINDYSTALEKKTLFDDEDITSAQTKLLQAGLQGKALQDLTALTLDYATATGTDAASAADVFARASQGNLMALAKVVPEIKNADGSMKSFSESVAILTKKYNGMAEAVANTPTAQITKFSNAFGNFKEMLGGLLAEGVQPFLEGLTSMFQFITGLSAPLKTFIGSMTVLGIALSGLIPILGIFGVSMAAAFWPITAAVVGISALMALAKSAPNITSDSAKKLQDQGKGIGIGGGGMPNPKESQKQVESIKTVGKNVSLASFNKAEKSAQPVDLKKELDDYTKLQLQKTNVLKSQLDQRHLSEQQTLDLIAEAQLKKSETDVAQTDAKLAALESFHAKELEQYSGNAAMKAQVDILYNEQKLALEQQRIQQEAALKDAEYERDKQRMMGGLQSFINMLDIKKQMTKGQALDFEKWQNFMAGATQSKNAEVAAISKAMAIYDIGLKTSQAAMSAYSAMAPIPFVGPALGIAAAGAAIAWGAEQAGKVASMQPALAEGGMLRSQAGGRSVTVAEGGNDEAVVPLDDPQTAQRIQNAAGGGGQTIQLVVDNMVLAETVVQGYNKGQNLGRVSKIQ